MRRWVPRARPGLARCGPFPLPCACPLLRRLLVLIIKTKCFTGAFGIWVTSARAARCEFASIHGQLALNGILVHSGHLQQLRVRSCASYVCDLNGSLTWWVSDRTSSNDQLPLD